MAVASFTSRKTMKKISFMSLTVLHFTAVALFAIVLAACTPPSTVIKPDAAVSVPAQAQKPAGTPSDLPPPAPREFRAAWVSTVANIDWPSRPDLTVAQQKAEIDAILERAQATHLNAIILQVRPSADAIYPSKIEPWTEYLTGEQGKAPVPFYDPLKTWIDGAHARGLELHAWFNPYRVRHTSAKSKPSADHISQRAPELVKTYGKFLWMDPGEPQAVQQTLDVMLDVVRRYDVDGVHIDDYFYPYPIPLETNGATADNGLVNGGSKAELDFPDEPSWNRYVTGGGKLVRADWRRENVNGLVERIYTGVHKEKPWVKVGISPFGLPRPDRRPAGIVGFSQYDKLYADAELWFNRGWVDYFTPQLYWPASQAGQSFPVLLDYWATQNTLGRALWPGMFTSRIGDKSSRAYTAGEIVSQIGDMRARSNNVSGHVHFSMAALTQDREGIATTLAAGQYATPALIPAMPWLDKSAPAAPVVSAQRSAVSLTLRFKAGEGKPPAQYAVWARCGGDWRFFVQPASRAELLLGEVLKCSKPGNAFVTAVDRVGNQSTAVEVGAAE
jgi:uncharacterized lipoprotein YddW (UPF0748 family)